MEIVKQFWSCGSDPSDPRCRSLKDDGYLGAEFAVFNSQIRVFFGNTGLAAGWAIVRHSKGFIFVEARYALDSGNGVQAEVTLASLSEIGLRVRMASVIEHAKANPLSAAAEELACLHDALNFFRGLN